MYKNIIETYQGLESKTISFQFQTIFLLESKAQSHSPLLRFYALSEEFFEDFLQFHRNELLYSLHTFETCSLDDSPEFLKIKKSHGERSGE